MLPRDHHLRRIETLDPERDYAEIFRLMAFHEFPWDGRIASKLMIWHLYAVPSSGRIMGSTYALVDRPVDRAETTSLTMGDLIEFGFDSARGRELLRSINRAHREWKISPDDLRFALAALGVLLIRWLDRYGWRAPTENERTATAVYYAELGRRLGAPGLPRRYDDLAAYLAACERDRFAYSEAGRLASERTLELGRSLLPRPLAPLLRPFVTAMLDPRVRAAVGLPTPLPLVRAGIDGLLRLRRQVVRRLPARSHPTTPRTRRAPACPWSRLVAGGLLRAPIAAYGQVQSTSNV